MFKRSTASLIAVLVLVSSLSFAQSKQPITHETMWLMKRVGAPVPSPDGKWVVYSITDPAYDSKESWTDLYVVASDGGDSRRLTFSKSGETTPVWSPDGKRIAFSAQREGDETAQIYLINVDGGEAQRVTTLSTGARSPQFSPDGKWLLFTSSVFPGAKNDEENKKIAKERKDRKYNVRVYESFPIRYWDRWLEDKKTHLFIQSAEPGAKAKDLLLGSKLDVEPGFSGQFTNSGEELQSAWTPDGKGIVFAATTQRNTAAFSNVANHLYLVPVDGGEPKALTTGRVDHGAPAFSPDGKTLYFTRTPYTDGSYQNTRLAALPWPSGGEPKVLTEGFDRNVGKFAVASDNKTIYISSEDAGLEKIYAVSAAGGEVKQAIDQQSGTFTNLVSAKNGPVLFATWESAVNPGEIFRLDPSKRSATQLSHVTKDKVAQIDWQPLKHFWFTAKNGKKIHNMVALPPNFDPNKKYPLLQLIHGGPHIMWRDQYFLRWNYHLIAQPGYVVLLTNYTGSTGFGETFAKEIKGDPFKGPGEELNEAVDAAIKEYPFVDGSRLAAGGASYGGHLANWLQGTTTKYKALIAHAGLINLESQWGVSDIIYGREVYAGGPLWEDGKVWREQNPIRFAKNFKTPMLLTVGENDFRVPMSQTLENWSVHQRMKVPSKLMVFPDENHWILKGENSRFFYSQLHDWLARWLKNDGSAAQARAIQ